MGITAQLADGTRLEFPDGTDHAVIQSTVKRVIAQGGQQPPSTDRPWATRAGEAITDFVTGMPRQVGLTARYAMEGLPAVGDVAWNPLRNFVANPALNAAGVGSMPSLEGSGRYLADLLGLPTPQGANERVVGNATRLVAGSGGMSALAKGATTLTTGLGQRVAQSMAASPGAAAVSAAGAGGAGGAAREGGANPWGEFAASLLGGLAAPVAMSTAAGAANKVSAAAKALVAKPQELDATLRLEFGRIGVDWDRLGESVRQQLRQDASSAVYSGQPLDAKSLQNLLQFRLVGAKPLLGDVTQDPRTLTVQRNLAKQQANMPNVFGAEDLAGLQNTNAKAVLSTLEGAATSPLDAGGTARGLMDVIGAKDARMASIEKALYARARDSEGRAVPLARGAFVEDANRRLNDTNAAAFLPDDLSRWLNTIAKGEAPFTVDTIDAYKRVLSQAMQKNANDGNARMAIRSIRDALDNVQLAPVKRDFGGGSLVTEQGAQYLQQGDAAPDAAMRAFDRARAFAAVRRRWGESAPFIEDALGGGDPERFVQRHIIGGRVDDLAKLQKELQASPELVDAVRKQMVAYILKRGRADSTTTSFSSGGMRDAVEALGDRRLGVFFKP